MMIFFSLRRRIDALNGRAPKAQVMQMLGWENGLVDDDQSLAFLDFKYTDKQDDDSKYGFQRYPRPLD